MKRSPGCVEFAVQLAGGVCSNKKLSDIMDIADLETKTLEQLRGMAKKFSVAGYTRLKKEDLILRLLGANAEKNGLTLRGGVLRNCR